MIGFALHIPLLHKAQLKFNPARDLLARTFKMPRPPAMFIAPVEREILCRLRDSKKETYELRERAAIILGTHLDKKWQLFRISQRSVDHWTRKWRWKQDDLFSIQYSGGTELLEEAIRFLLSDNYDPFEWQRRYRNLPARNVF